MRLAVISDIHGNLTAFKAMLADLETVGELDTIWHLGDYAAFGPRPVECIQLARGMAETYGKDKVKFIGGNTDRYLLTGERYPMPPAKEGVDLKAIAKGWQSRDTVLNWNLSQLGWEEYEFLSKIMGREIATTVQGYGPIIGFHAVPGNDEPMSLKPDTTDEEARDSLLDREGILAICGHTHLRMDRDLGNWRVINPGSVGLSNSQPGKAEWALLTFEGDSLTVDLRSVDYDTDAMIADVRASEMPEGDWFIARAGLTPAS